MKGKAKQTSKQATNLANFRRVWHHTISVEAQKTRAFPYADETSLLFGSCSKVAMIFNLISGLMKNFQKFERPVLYSFLFSFLRTKSPVQLTVTVSAIVWIKGPPVKFTQKKIDILYADFLFTDTVFSSSLAIKDCGRDPLAGTVCNQFNPIKFLDPMKQEPEKLKSR